VFASEVALTVQLFADVRIVVDDENCNPILNETARYPLVELIVLHRSEAIALKGQGYWGFNKPIIMDHPVTAWDKAMFIAAEENPHLSSNYAYVWLIEHDVFVAHPSLVLKLTKHVIENSFDFIAPPLEKVEGWISFKTLPKLTSMPPFWKWYRCMVCTVIMSRKYLDTFRFALRQYPLSGVINEAVLPSLALFAQLSFHSPQEFRKVVWRSTDWPRNETRDKMNWSLESISKEPFQWYHPVKSREKQAEYRKRLSVHFTRSSPAASLAA